MRRASHIVTDALVMCLSRAIVKRAVKESREQKAETSLTQSVYHYLPRGGVS